jgi:nitrogen-specific signal transduction histidine kinase
MSSVAGLQPAGNILSAEVFGQVAHELRQPLSNIESIAYYLTLILPRQDTKIQDQLARIRQLVEQSNWILASGLRLAAATPPVPEALDLEELITQAVASQAAPYVSLRLELAGNLPLVRLDPRQGREMMDTLLLLVRPLASQTSPAVFRTSACETGMLFEVLAFSSTILLGAGSELSIESVRQIVRAHAGTLECKLDHPTPGIHIRVMLP